ncbi:MAG: type II secretion system GspH family protein [Sterolibacteriaceae bacterium MAG5]|nr:type II secretion system GspH family protein [Candidatus Nitricoxidireducens bremensis]
MTSRGFTLTELAVVMAIVALLLGGLLVPLTAQMDLRNRQETERALAAIREALIGFAAIHGRLPCPAPAALATGSLGAGIEATTAASGTTATVGPCGCTAAASGVPSAGGVACDEANPTAGLSGVLPWATLGLPEADAWGNRYSYRVTTRFARVASGQTAFGCTPSANPVAAAFALCSGGDILVLSAAAGGSPLASGLPALVLSHGRNGHGAYNAAGAQQAMPTNGDEAANADGDGSFVGNPATDDQLVWIPPGVLMNRMLAAGRLP